MLSAPFVPFRWLRVCLVIALTCLWPVCVGAVPPTKDDGSQKGDAHPADGRVAEKIADASAEGQQAMSALRSLKVGKFHCSLLSPNWLIRSASSSTGSPVSLYVNRFVRVSGHRQSWPRSRMATCGPGCSKRGRSHCISSQVAGRKG